MNSRRDEGLGPRSRRARMRSWDSSGLDERLAQVGIWPNWIPNTLGFGLNQMDPNTSK